MKKKTSQDHQFLFTTRYVLNGEEYGGVIWAKNWQEAEDFVKQRAASEIVTGKTDEKIILE